MKRVKVFNYFHIDQAADISLSGECPNTALLLLPECMVIFSTNIRRDRSAVVSMRRVPQAASREGEEARYQDDWLEFYHRPETEKEFPLRNRQVSRFVGVQLPLIPPSHHPSSKLVHCIV